MHVDSGPKSCHIYIFTIYTQGSSEHNSANGTKWAADEALIGQATAFCECKNSLGEQSDPLTPNAMKEKM